MGGAGSPGREGDGGLTVRGNRETRPSRGRRGQGSGSTKAPEGALKGLRSEWDGIWRLLGIPGVGGAGNVCELGLRSGPPYLSGELPSGAKGSPSGRCSPSGPGQAAEPLLILPLPPSMPVGGAAVRALVLKRSRWPAPTHA